MKPKQTWEVGNTVKVGFLTLRITSTLPNHGWNGQKGYSLVSLDGTKSYTFTPYEGLERN